MYKILSKYPNVFHTSNVNKILNNNNNTNIRNQAKSPIYKNKSDNSNQSRPTPSKPNNPATPTATATTNNSNNNKSPTLVEQTKKSHPSSTQSQSQILKNQKLPQYLSTTNMVRQPLNKTTPPANNLTNFSNNYYKSEFIDYANSNPLGNSNFGSPKTTNQTKLSQTAQNNLANTNKNILSNPSAVTNPYTNNNNVSYNPMFSSNNNVANSNKPAASMPNYYPTMTQQQMASGQYYQPQIQPQTPQTAKGGQYQYMMPQYPQQPAQAPQIQPQYSQYYQKTSF